MGYQASGVTGARSRHDPAGSGWPRRPSSQIERPLQAEACGCFFFFANRRDKISSGAGRYTPGEQKMPRNAQGSPRLERANVSRSTSGRPAWDVECMTAAGWPTGLRRVTHSPDAPCRGRRAASGYPPKRGRAACAPARCRSDRQVIVLRAGLLNRSARSRRRTFAAAERTSPRD